MKERNVRNRERKCTLSEERIKNLETKADKVEMLLTMNFCISIFGAFLFFFLGSMVAFFSIIFGIFLGIYGIINLIILYINNKKSPK